MGRMYTAVFEQVAVTAAQDFFEVNAPTDAIVVVHRVVLTQSSDAGDAQAEMLPVLIHRGTDSGSGGSTPTPRPLEVGDPAFGGTVEANNTTVSTEGNQIHAESFHVSAGFDYTPTPECRPVISPGGRLNVTLQAAPNDSLTMDGTIVFEEIGG